MEKDLDVVTLITKLLDEAKYKEAISVPNEEKYLEDFKDNCWDLISAVVGKINDDIAITKPSLLSACEELLTTIVQRANPEEALLEFIEQIEVAKNDSQFSIILNPLQLLLKKLSIKRGRSLEWCLNSISGYIESIPMPEHELEDKERLLMDCDPNIRRISRVYALLRPFYSCFITEITANDANIKTKQIITAFLISLLGKPLIYIDLDPDTNATSEARQCCASIVQDICTVEKDALKFLVHLERCARENQKQKDNADLKYVNETEPSPYEQKEKLNMDTLSGFFYAIFSGHFTIAESATPQVYSTDYIVQTGFLSAIHFLSYTQFGPLAKAMSVSKALLTRLDNNASHNLLQSSVHFDLCKGLVNVAIYSSYESIRKNAVSLIGLHINKFDFKGRCMLIKYVLDFANHSGMIGYAITLYKNSINEAFSAPGELPECFTGASLANMVKKICHLPHGAESDIMELADQIITALNFLRYLVIKDTNNVTGIKSCFTYLESEYLSQLRVGLNMSKAHYEVKLKEIEEGKCSDDDSKISINVGGNVLSNIPRENIKEIIISALNAFHLIEGLLARLSECINLNKMQGLTLRNGRRLIAPLSAVRATQKVRTLQTYNKSFQEKAKSDSSIVEIHENDDQQYEDNIKNRILEKALEFVSHSGWSVESISAGAEAAGYPGVAHGLFPHGGGDLVHYFNVKCNEQLVEVMKNWPKTDLSDQSVPTKFVEDAIVTRLLMIEPYKSTWPKAMAIQALPNNVPNCLATLLSLVDDICYHSGDRSVDFNWYIRRVGLAGIYKASELFYLTSQGEAATRGFVAARIRDAQLIQTAMNLNPVSVAPQTLTAAFVTAKNILGINTLK